MNTVYIVAPGGKLVEHLQIKVSSYARLRAQIKKKYPQYREKAISFTFRGNEIIAEVKG